MTSFHYSLRAGVLLGLLSLTAACWVVAFSAGAAPTPPKKAETAPMMTYPIGRFELDVPKAFTLAIQTQKLRYIEITEIPWPKDVPREQARKLLWEARLSEINKLRPPKGKDKALVEMRELSNAGEWARGVLYYGNDASIKDGFWDILADGGAVAVWFKLSGLIQYQSDMLKDLTDTARAYTPGDPLSFGRKGDWFYTRYGAFNLPYLEQERTYSRFEGHPLNVKFEITTTETHQVETSGPLERLAAALATNFAPGVNVDRIRGGKRSAAGLNGEEIVLRMTNDDKTSTLRFGWESPGKVDSGNAPEIRIEMEAKDGQLDEKLKLWDALLNSFKPVGPVNAMKSGRHTIERLELQFDGRAWSIGYAASNGTQGAATEYVLPGETVHAWTELVTIEQLPSAQRHVDVHALIETLREQLALGSAGFSFHVLERHGQDVLYEWRHDGCRRQGQGAQHEISRFVKGKSGIHRVAYVTRVNPLPPQTREQWVKLIGQANLPEEDGRQNRAVSERPGRRHLQ